MCCQALQVHTVLKVYVYVIQIEAKTLKYYLGLLVKQGTNLKMLKG